MESEDRISKGITPLAANIIVKCGLWGLKKMTILIGKPIQKFSMAHQCHDVIGQVPSQIRGHKTRQTSEGNTCVIHVGTAKILVETNVKKEYVTQKWLPDRQSYLAWNGGRGGKRH